MGQWSPHGRDRTRETGAAPQGIDGSHRAAAVGGEGLRRPCGRGSDLRLPGDSPAREGCGQGRPTDCRLVLQRIGGGGSGRHGGQRHDRPAAAAHAGRQGREVEGREAVMVYLLLESALRSLALGGAVWLGLTLLRVRNPHAHMTAWIVVLVASLSMPILMHRLTLTVPAAAPALRVIETIPALSSNPLEAPHVTALPVQGPLDLPPAAAPAVVNPPRQAMPAPVDRRSLGWPGFDWRALATAVYLLVAGALLLRLFTGLLLSWRMARAARPIPESWAGDADIRVSDLVGVPVTFGSTVLLPVEYVDWSEAKRQAVLSHEGSHVAHGDFYVLLLAAFNRAVFWFSPFAWWQLVRLSELAEIISDDAALEMLDDRSSYARILLDVAGGPQRAPVAIAMARACTVRKRVERILAGTAAPARMGWRKRALVAATLAPAVIISEGAIVLSASKPPAEPIAVAPSVSTPQADALAVAPASNGQFLDRYVGHYEADPKVLPGLVLTVTREGDHLFVR